MTSMRWFEFGHLPPHLREVSSRFADLAWHLVRELPEGEERDVALRKLLESKDAAVRSRISAETDGKFRVELGEESDFDRKVKASLARLKREEDCYTETSPITSLAAYASDTLGLKLWSRQIEVLNAVEKRSRVYVSAGDKTGMTTLASAAALGWAARGQRVFVLAGTDLDLYRLQGWMMGILGAGVRLPENVHLTPSNKAEEAIAGCSGPILYVVYGAEGLTQKAWWDVVDCATGDIDSSSRLLVIGQGLRPHRPYMYPHFSVSSEEAAETGVLGLATPDWIESRRREWGENSALYRVRVLGLAAEEESR